MSAAELALIPLRWNNLLTARHVAVRIFPRESRAISCGLVASLLPRSLQPFFVDPEMTHAAYELAIKPREEHPVVGLTGLYTLRAWPSDVWLGWYGLDARWRGHGLGGALLRATIEQARDRGHETLRLWTTGESSWTAAAIRLYRAFGFVSQSTGYAYHGDPVEIYSFGLRGPAKPLALTDFASILVAADRGKLTAIDRQRSTHASSHGASAA
jgi:GNAT superfamily N-acetyltransferase